MLLVIKATVTCFMTGWLINSRGMWRATIATTMAASAAANHWMVGWLHVAWSCVAPAAAAKLCRSESRSVARPSPSAGL